MRTVLMSASLAAVAGFAVYWLQATYVRPYVPRWLDALLYGVTFGLTLAFAGWAAGALGWARPEPQWGPILGGMGAGALLGVALGIRDRHHDRARRGGHAPR